VLIFVFALLKNLVDDYSTIWSYIGVLLAAGVAYGAWLRSQEAGGVAESQTASNPACCPSEPAAPTPAPPAATPEGDETPGTSEPSGT
jgi:hypothetical protein